MYVIIGNDNIKPPVGPNNICSPPVKFANIGIPIAPKITYNPWAINPLFEPNIIPVSDIANVCKVSGTPPGKGIAIWANTDVIDANKQKTQARIEFLNSIISYNKSQIGQLFEIGRMNLLEIKQGYENAKMLYGR